MFKRILEPLSEPAFLLLRAVSGLCLAVHGMQKIFGFHIPADKLAHFPSQAWFGGIIELTAGFLMAAGLFTRCAAFIASGTMAVAYTQFHWKLALGANFFPPINKGELALVYCVLFFYF